MSIISSLKLTDQRKYGSHSPELRFRSKALEALNEQLAIVQTEIEGKTYSVNVRRFITDGEGNRVVKEGPKRLRKWFWHNTSGVWFLEFRYGNKPLELVKGKPVIEVGKREELVPTLTKLIEAVQAGELDTLLKAAAHQRSRINGQVPVGKMSK